MKFEKIAHDLIQGSPEWLQFRLTHFGASEAAAMLGLSTKVKRTELLHAKHTGIAREYGDWLQKNVLDHGHEVEALARPIIERILGIELGPVTCSLGKLSASTDGLTMFHDTAFEHKQWSEALAAAVRAKQLPEEHQPQSQQILMVTGAKRVIFTVSDGTEANMEYMEVLPDPAWFARIEAGWDQFEKDLAEYVPAAPEPVKVVGHGPDQLPALRSSVKGELVLESNIKEWEEAALAYIKAIRERELKTDEDFANADAATKWCESSKTKLEGLKASLMAATGDVNTSVDTIERIMSELDKTRLAFNKAITLRKDARKGEIVADGVAKFKEHVAGLNKLLGKDYMPPIAVDFGGCIRNMRSFANMTDAVATTLANAKIEADAKFKTMMANMTWLRENATEYTGLFADTATLVLKAPDDFRAQAENRISQHQAAEAKKEAETRERIRAEEEARANRLAKEEQERIAREAAAANLAAAVQVAQPAQPAPSALVSLFNDAFNTTAQVGQAIAVTNVTPARAPDLLDTVPMPVVDTGAKIKLGEIGARLGFEGCPLNITADFLEKLGFTATVERNAKLYRESQWPAICEALIQHITQVADLQPA